MLRPFRSGISNRFERLSSAISKVLCLGLLTMLSAAICAPASAQKKSSSTSSSKKTASGDRDPQEPYPIKGQIRMTTEMWEMGIPDGKVRLPGELDRVATFDTNKRPCVAKVHLHVDDNFIVMLPDGQLVGRKREDVSATEKPFKPLTHDKLAKAIMKEFGMQGGFRVEKTENFVVIYNTSPEFAEVTGKVLQTMLNGVLEYTRDQGLKTKKPDVVLPILAFRTEQQFQQFKPMPQGVAAYYEIISNRVILKEESSLARISDQLATEELLSTIAHEGGHQLLANIGVQQRMGKWPMWLGEGIAEYMAPTKPGRKFAWKGAGKINDLRMFELETYLYKQLIKGFNGDTVNETILASRLDSTHYATAWTITHYLAENHKKSFDRYMRYLSRMAPLHGMMPENMRDPKATVEANLVHFKAFFGEDIEEFENDMVKYMTQQRYTSPFEEFPHYTGTAIIPGIDEDKVHVSIFPMKHDMQEWMFNLRESLTDYEKEHFDPDVQVHNGRGPASRYISKWKRENRPKKRRKKTK